MTKVDELKGDGMCRLGVAALFRVNGRRRCERITEVEKEVRRVTVASESQSGLVLEKQKPLLAKFACSETPRIKRHPAIYVTTCCQAFPGRAAPSSSEAVPEQLSLPFNHAAYHPSSAFIVFLNRYRILSS